MSAMPCVEPGTCMGHAGQAGGWQRLTGPLMAFPGLLMVTLELRTKIAKLDHALDSNLAISQTGLGKCWPDTVANGSDPLPQLVSTDCA